MDLLLSTLLEPFLDPGSRTYWGGLLAAAVVALVVHRAGGGPLRGIGAVARHPSSRLDLQLLLGRQLLRLIGLGSGVAGSWWIATHLVRWLDGVVGRPALAVEPTPALALAYSVTLFVCWDASRYALHRAMHAVPALWELHSVHHSAEVLTPLTFHRVHPLESALYQARGALVTGLVTGAFFWAVRGAAVDVTLLGVNALGFMANVASGNLRHSHVWLSFGARIERWLVSPPSTSCTTAPTRRSTAATSAPGSRSGIDSAAPCAWPERPPPSPSGWVRALGTTATT